MFKRISSLFLCSFLVINLALSSLFSVSVYAENKPKTLWDCLQFYPTYIIDSAAWLRGWVEGNGTHLMDVFKYNAQTLNEWHEAESWEDFCKGIEINETEDENGNTIYNFPANYVSIINATISQLKDEYDEDRPYRYFRTFAPSDIQGQGFAKMAQFEKYRSLIEKYTSGEYESCIVYSWTPTNKVKNEKFFCVLIVPFKTGQVSWLMGSNTSNYTVIPYVNWQSVYLSSGLVTEYIYFYIYDDPMIEITENLMKAGEYELANGALIDHPTKVLPYNLSYSNTYEYEAYNNNEHNWIKYNAQWNNVYNINYPNMMVYSSSHLSYKAFRSIDDLRNIDTNTYKPPYYIIDNDKFNNPPSGDVNISQDQIDNSIHYGDIDNSLTQYINENHYHYSGISEEALQAIIEMILRQFNNNPSPSPSPSPSPGSSSGTGGNLQNQIVIHNNNNNYWNIGGSSSENSVSGNDWNLGGFFGGAGSFLHALVEGIVNLIGALLDQLTALVELIADFFPRIIESIPTAMTDLLTAVFPFLPPEVGLAISLSVVLLLIAVFIKMFKS
ncbi:MAG: hypothetical protein K6F35_07995 [Lachnospiraceae bacterium]|nr:hypothetical protein [Lachnospiraceae bacterium]